MSRFVFAVNVEDHLEKARREKKWALPRSRYEAKGQNIRTGDRCIFYVTKNASSGESYFEFPAIITSKPDVIRSSIYGDGYAGDFQIEPAEIDPKRKGFDFIYLKDAKAKLGFTKDWIRLLQGRGLQQGNPIVEEDGIRLFDLLWQRLCSAD